MTIVVNLDTLYRNLETAYQVAAHIQDLVASDNIDEKCDQLWCHYSDKFRLGPDGHKQTREGIVLEEFHGMPYALHTPLGTWQILEGFGNNSWKKVMEAIKTQLGLELIHEAQNRFFGHEGPWWAITQWNGKQIERPVYRQASEQIPHEKAREIWKDFVAIHKDPTPPRLHTEEPSAPNMQTKEAAAPNVQTKEARHRSFEATKEFVAKPKELETPKSRA